MISHVIPNIVRTLHPVPSPSEDSVGAGHRPVCAMPLSAAAAYDGSGVCMAVMLPDSLYAWPGVSTRKWC